MKGREPAWDDCKVAFHIKDANKIWRLFEAGKLQPLLPSGWEFNGTDGSGTRTVALFRIKGTPLISDSKKVRTTLNKLRT